MKINREKPPQGEEKDPTALPRYPLQSKTGAKNRRVCTTHDWTYRICGQNSRVQLRSQTSSPDHLPDEQGKEADDTNPSLSTASCADD